MTSSGPCSALVTRGQVAGMTSCVAHLPSAHSLTAVLQVDVGSGDDPPGREGLAHVCEHERAARATTLHPAAGVVLNGVTEAGWTRFTLTCATADWRVGIARLTALLDPEPLPEPALAREVDAVRIEMQRSWSRPALRLGPLMAAAALPGTDVGRLAATTPSTLAAVEHADVVDFVHRQYRAARCTVAVASAVPAVEIFEALRAGTARLSRSDTDACDATPGVEAAATPSRARGGAGGGWSEGFGRSATLVVTLARERPRGDEQLAGSALAHELVTGPRGVLDELLGLDGLHIDGAATLSGRRHDVTVLRCSRGAHADRAVGRLRRAVLRPDPEALPDEDRIRRAGTRARLVHGLQQQSPGGLTAQLVGWLTGTAPFPGTLVRPGAVSGAAVRSQAAALLAAIRLWLLEPGTDLPEELV